MGELDVVVLYWLCVCVSKHFNPYFTDSSSMQNKKRNASEIVLNWLVLDLIF